MTWTMRKLPSGRIEYQTWVSVWKPLLLMHIHCDVNSSSRLNLTSVSLSVSLPTPLWYEGEGQKFWAVSWAALPLETCQPRVRE